MMKKFSAVSPTATRIIDITPTTGGRIIDTTPCTTRPIEPEEIARALGAEPTGVQVPTNLNPLTRYAVRAELFQRQQSKGTAPSPEGNNVSPQISLSDQEWLSLEALAAKIAASTPLSPSPGQVGSALLSLALRSLTTEANENGGPACTAGLVDELAARASA